MTTRIGKSLAVLSVLAVPSTRVLAQQTHDMPMEMHLQPGAEHMKVSVQSPAGGSTVTGNTVHLRVATTGFHDRCDLAGKPNQAGQGHYHVLIDKSLVNMFCTRTATVSMQDVTPGVHTLTVVPAQNDHAEVEHNARSVRINYQPHRPLPAVSTAARAGTPSIKIVSPRSGATVSGKFDIVVEVTNFNLSCALFGKPDVPGYGHWHLNFDTMTGPMMGMMTMAGMSCQRVLHTSSEGLKPGSTHTLITLLANNAHAPLNPAVADSVTVTVR